MLSDADMGRLVQLDGVVATVDAVQLATRVHGGLVIDTDHGIDRLAFADRIIAADGYLGERGRSTAVRWFTMWARCL